ncbi:hypothetical protein SAMN02745857_03169 [Andreprevotia lacus DSM 23236]|uniref:Uncharacterized protein n=1 Tax=Andreprevotia lacus DSM 23236 TaxID=1121001 RepID=A0A1W1XW92_9NEIS|nr:hypothetical protein [Andreprevotia lacus]SMC28229.1 hypothetical protein SAMN02745857_03169 [Andreprevotia lacus DSM 23236]
MFSRQSIAALLALLGGVVVPQSWAEVNVDAPVLTPTEAHAEERSAWPLGAQIIMTADEAATRDAWKSPKEPVDMLETREIKVGKPLSIGIVFAGCNADATGKCDVTVNYRILTPDADEYAKLDKVLLWKGPAGPGPSSMIMGSNFLKVVVAPKEPHGRYVVDAVVTDNVTHQSVPLEDAFVVKK